VFSIQSAKDSLKGMADWAMKQLRGEVQPHCGQLRKKYEEQNSNLWSVIIVRSDALLGIKW
jgi:hypothetical protein